MPFFRQFQHLLPSGAAWRLALSSTLRKFFEGLAGPPADVRSTADTVFEDAFPDTTAELAEFETQFGLQSGTDDALRRAGIDAAWKSRGGQSPQYLQDVVRAAGFDLFIHEWWDPNEAAFVQIQCGDPLAQCGEPRAECSDHSFRHFVRNPLLYTNQPLIGTTQCGEDLAQCGEPNALCNSFLANEPGYLVNDLLTDTAPPPIPDDTDAFHYFLYWGAETFPDHAEVDATRRAELERLVLKLCPTQQWLVMLVDYV